jgi:hypothetical protein
VAVPDEWDEVPLTEDELKEYFQQLASVNPQYADTIDKVIGTGAFRRYLLWAIGRNEVVEKAPSVLVEYLAASAPVWSLDVLDEIKPSILEALPGARITGAEADLTIDGKEAARIQYEYEAVARDGGVLRIRAVGFYVISGSGVYAITVEGPRTASLTSTAETIGTSFRLR